ncbi:hypothetical protein [Rhodopseudomonas sp. B29]|uniref:hypothetical protein n=1 Tax=Rhodopseudomonas sp. B29 TaxID=95607 RepID=UPI00034B3D18|nr:hypothetical protein [Rhodopseudomonas sp. B29]
MIKRAILASAMLGAATVAHAAGTVSGFSMTPQFDTLGKVAPGCKLYVYQAGTVATPQNAYQDSGLSTALPNPLSCDASGRLPQFFLADGLIKLRLTTSAGTPIGSWDNLLVVGPSGGGGGGGVIDPTTIYQTGDVKISYGSDALDGWVRMNGRTIGSATSGATERANSDTQALFLHLWTNDSALTVSGGRGASAAADWAANKTIALPDLRGRVIAGIDGMGSTASGRLSLSSFGTYPTYLGANGGSDYRTIARDQLPNVSPTFSGSSGLVNVTSSGGSYVQGGVVNTSLNGAGTLVGISTYYNSGYVGSSGYFTPSGTVESLNGGVSQRNLYTVQPTVLMTIYLKL